jgi:two-component system, cell cycle response regulator DivK
MITALIAEDNPVNRELLRELLEARGFSVAEADDGDEALKTIAQQPPDVLLLDLGMPKLDGFEVVRQIRQNPRSAHLRIVAVTAFAMRGDREKALQSGFDGYVSKPINALLLSAELDRVLNRSRDSCEETSNSP